MAEVFVLSEYSRCFCCLSKNYDKRLEIHNIQNIVLRNVLQMQQLVLCYICKRLAEKTEQFVKNVERYRYQSLYQRFMDPSQDTDGVLTKTQVMELTMFIPTLEDVIELSGKDENTEQPEPWLEIKQEVEKAGESSNKFPDSLDWSSQNNAQEESKRESESSSSSDDDDGWWKDVKVKTIAKTRDQVMEERRKEAAEEKYVKIKEECKESPDEIEETKNKYADSDETLTAEDDTDYQNYSSDDDLTLSFMKLNNKIQEPEVTTPKLKSKDDKTTKQKLKTESEAKENIDTAVVKTAEAPLTKTDETFKCLTCFEIIDTKKNLLNHYKYKHKPIQIGDKRKNCVIMNGLNTFQCTKCKKVFYYQKPAKKHGYHCIHKIEGRPFICNLCGRTFISIYDIIGHGRVHGVVKYVCSFKCGFSTKYPSALKVHEKRHKKEYKFKCEECGRGFFERDKYESHQNTHTGARPFTCDLCGVSYSTKRYLAKHRGSVHHESSKSDRYVCIHCSLHCGNKDALKEHLAEAHGLMSYHCDICGETFSTVGELCDHKKQHNGLKPHTCSTCSKSFTQRRLLKRHVMLTHSGVKLHACIQCDKHFQHRSSLVTHTMRYHNTSATNTLNVKMD